MHYKVADDEIKDVAHIWLHVEEETFFADGVWKLLDQSNKCVEKQSDCCEK
jgi:hypothetical protein